MLLEPSRYNQFVERRELLGWELSLGGHGQIPISGNSLQVPTSGYNFYAFLFTTATTLSSVVFADYYTAAASSYRNVTFPAGAIWYAPVSGISLNVGTAIGYQYQRLSLNATLPTGDSIQQLTNGA